MRKPTGNVTEAAGKRKVAYNIPAMSLRNSTPSSNQSEEQGKRLKLDSSRDSNHAAN
ncbi:hypothetical protein V1520DRAFT_348457 [Lipomyces starkeyi]